MFAIAYWHVLLLSVNVIAKLWARVYHPQILLWSSRPEFNSEVSWYMAFLKTCWVLHINKSILVKVSSGHTWDFGKVSDQLESFDSAAPTLVWLHHSFEELIQTEIHETVTRIEVWLRKSVSFLNLSKCYIVALTFNSLGSNLKIPDQSMVLERIFYHKSRMAASGGTFIGVPSSSNNDGKISL